MSPDFVPHPPLGLLTIHHMPVVMFLIVPLPYSPHMLAVVVGTHQKDRVTVMKGLQPCEKVYKGGVGMGGEDGRMEGGVGMGGKGGRIEGEKKGGKEKKEGKKGERGNEKRKGGRNSATRMIILIIQWAMLSRSKHYSRN